MWAGIPAARADAGCSGLPGAFVTREDVAMKHRFSIWLAALALTLASAPLFAQIQTGDISGRVTDNTGAIVPGVTVTISGPALLSAVDGVTSETGTYQFPRLPIGTYDDEVRDARVQEVVREGVRVSSAFTAQINQQLEISTVEETVTVTGESPMIDTKSTTARTTFDLETLQNIPSARDPWVMLERVPEHHDGPHQRRRHRSRASSPATSAAAPSTGNNKWSMDGVDITDMSATGASPIYYDFDMLQEMRSRPAARMRRSRPAASASTS